jgi:RNA polymerase sigma factor (sigma-70 family)
MKRNLLEDHLGLVYSIVSKFDRNTADSDLFGIGCVALVEAHKSYVPEKGAFSTWATKLIKQSIFNNFRKNKKSKMQNLENGECLNLVDDSKATIPAEILSTLLADEEEDTKADKENKKILIDHFLNDKSWAEIGRELSLTRERVRQKGMEAIQKIRQKYRLIIDDIEFFHFVG